MEFNIEEELRLDKLLTSKLDISRSKVQKLIDEGKVLVNGEVAIASKTYKLGSSVIVNDELDYTINVEAEDIPLDILYEDQYLLIVNKKSGMVVHPAPGNYTGTLVNALLYHFNISNTNNIRPGIVHRIDKDTSGVMVVAKDEKAFALLGELIKNHDIERKYIALVDGVIMHDTGTIDAPIGRDVKYREKMEVTDINSKNAITHFTVIKRFADKTLIECKLETGRTHQIRVHMAYIGYPIYNDPLYGKSRHTSSFGQFLHSKSIRFIHPITGEEIYIESDLPKEFNDYLEEIS